MIVVAVAMAVGLAVALILGGFDKPCEPSQATCLEQSK